MALLAPKPRPSLEDEDNEVGRTSAAVLLLLLLLLLEEGDNDDDTMMTMMTRTMAIWAHSDSR